MGKKIDPVGHKYGRLSVLKYADHQGTYRRFLCRCDCGKMTVARLSDMRQGKLRSCGCLKREIVVAKNRSHMMSESREYEIWSGIKKRCYNKKHKSYKHYGGRGIVVCPSWIKSFEKFLADMGPSPTDKHSVERINNNGPYSKKNCRWATYEEQANNRRGNRHLFIDGEKLSLAQASKKYNLPYMLIQSRHKNYGWTDRECVGLDKHESKHGRYIMINGERMRVAEAARKYGLNVNMVFARLRKGWAPKEALEAPRGGRR